MRNTDVFNLDFTSLSVLRDMTEQAVAKVHSEAGTKFAAEAIRELEEAMARGCREEAAWRLLGTLYIGTDRIKDLNALEEKHEELFGTTIFAIPQQRRVERNATRRLFDMPARITEGGLPPPDEVAAACATPEGAEFDFSRVRGADAGGLEALRVLFSRLPRDRRPVMLGIEPVLDGLLKAASSPSGTKPMWQALFEYHRFAGNDDALRDLMTRFRARFPS